MKSPIGAAGCTADRTGAAVMRSFDLNALVDLIPVRCSFAVHWQSAQRFLMDTTAAANRGIKSVFIARLSPIVACTGDRRLPALRSDAFGSPIAQHRASTSNSGIARIAPVPFGTSAIFLPLSVAGVEP